MVCAPVRSIIPSLKLGDYLSVQAHKPCSISHLSYTLNILSPKSLICKYADKISISTIPVPLNNNEIG